MSDLSRVPGPSSPFKGSSAKLLTVVLVGILVAILKPWGGAAAPSAIGASARPSAPAGATPVATPSPALRDAFDFGIFEGFEPQPAWEIWPAGREFSLGFAMKVTADAEDRPPGAPAASGAPPSGAPTSAPPASVPPVAERTATPAPTRPSEPPTWSHTITISPASTLTVVAINMPLDFRVPGIRLWHTDPRGGREETPIVRVPSPWPDHFLVIGIDDGTGRDVLRAWPPGQYELVLQIEPGDHVRTIVIDVEGRPATSPTPAASDAPAPAVS
jgi:hypothetical protein